MPDAFREAVKRLPKLLQELRRSPARTRAELSGVPTKGVYVFFENEKAMYVGRSNKLRTRIQEHGRPGSDRFSATFAFLLAQKTAGEAGTDLKRTRKVLEKDKQFAAHFADAKRRVSRMKVRLVKVPDAVQQTLFEVYAALKLRTRYNDFETH